VAARGVTIRPAELEAYPAADRAWVATEDGEPVAHLLAAEMD
jgi:hypothetical protein